MLEKVKRHRELVRASADEEIQKSWDEIEEFIDFFYQEVGARDNAKSA